MAVKIDCDQNFWQWSETFENFAVTLVVIKNLLWPAPSSLLPLAMPLCMLKEGESWLLIAASVYMLKLVKEITRYRAIFIGSLTSVHGLHCPMTARSQALWAHPEEKRMFKNVQPSYQSFNFNGQSWNGLKSAGWLAAMTISWLSQSLNTKHLHFAFSCCMIVLGPWFSRNWSQRQTDNKHLLVKAPFLFLSR